MFQEGALAGYPQERGNALVQPGQEGPWGQIRKALQLLLTAKRPYIYTGGGVLLGNATQELRTLVDMLGYPVTNTLMGLGASSGHRSCVLVGMLGMHGTMEANNAMQNCDVLLAVGARFDDRVIGNPGICAERPQDHPYRHRSPSSISKRVKVDIPSSATSPGGADRADRHGPRETTHRPTLAPWPPGGDQIEAGAAATALKYDRGNTEVTCRSTWWRRCGT